MIEQILAMSIAEQQELIEKIQDSWPPSELVLPKGLDSSFAKGRFWDYDKLIPAFEKVNPHYVNKDNIKKCLNKHKLQVKTLKVLGAEPLKRIPNLDEVFETERQYWKYPSNKKRQAAYHLFLNSTQEEDEGEAHTVWYAKNTLTALLPNLKGKRLSFSSISICRDGAMPYLDMVETPELEQNIKDTLKSGLSERHLLGEQKHYNYDLIQLELLVWFDVWFRPSQGMLMPKHLILNPE